jgi:hypothetical protein
MNWDIALTFSVLANGAVPVHALVCRSAFSAQDRLFSNTFPTAFCRYALLDHGARGDLQDPVAAIDVQESNFEVRADKFADLILDAVGQGVHAIPCLAASARGSRA